MLKSSKVFNFITKSSYNISDKFPTRLLREEKILAIIRFYSSKEAPTENYGNIEQLALPSNLENLPSSEKLKFSPQRNRDINGSYMSSNSEPLQESSKNFSAKEDELVECYNSSSAVNLSSSMQTNVPKPFTSNGKPTHLNMPGGQWSQKEKYTSGDLNNFHHSNIRRMHTGCNNKCYCFINQDEESCKRVPVIHSKPFHFRSFSSEKEEVQVSITSKDDKEIANNLTRKEKIKAAVKHYGGVVIVFHVGISLVSLGCCYLIVASGTDLSEIFQVWGLDEGAVTAGTAAQFVVAYAIHKAMAPGRVAITLAAVPFLVKKLRKIGVLKKPKTSLP